MSKNECKHEKQGRAAASRFMGWKDDMLPEVVKVALRRGLSIQRPIAQLTLSEVFRTPLAPESSITVRLQMSVPERPTYDTLEDFYHDLATLLATEYMDKQARGKFKNEVVVVDASHKTVIELDGKTARKVGAKRVELSVTYIQDVTSEIRNALEVEVEE